MKNRFYRNIFSMAFIFLLFTAEIFSGQNTFPSEGKKDFKINSNTTFAGTNYSEKTVFTKSSCGFGSYDIEAGKNLENISNGIVRIGQRARSYRQNRRIGQMDDPVLETLLKIFLLWLHVLKVFLFLGIAVTYSLQYIIQYIHDKNGEKMKKSLSENMTGSYV